MSAKTPLIEQDAPDLAVPMDLDTVQEKLVEEFGGDGNDEKLNSFLADIEDMNFYDYSALMWADPQQGFETFRSEFKILLLPMMQIAIPILLMVNKYKSLDEHGLCPDNHEWSFRMIAGITYVYSVWQIADGIHEGPTLMLIRLAARHFRITGNKLNMSFSLGFVLQAICGILLEACLFLLFCSSDDPMDLVMNCVALNFLLDIDTEWINDRQKAKGLKAAAWLWSDWRKHAQENKEMVEHRAKKKKTLRKIVVPLVDKIISVVSNVILFLGYVLALYLFGCDGSW